VLRGHAGALRSVAFSPDGTRLVSGSWDHTLRLWDVKSGALIRVLKGHGDAVHTAVFSPDGRAIVSGSADKTVRLWNAGTGALVKELYRGEDPVFGLAFTPDGQRLLARNVPRRACAVLSFPEGKILTRFEKHDNSVTADAVSPDGQVAASGGGNDQEI